MRSANAKNINTLKRSIWKWLFTRSRILIIWNEKASLGGECYTEWNKNEWNRMRWHGYEIERFDFVIYMNNKTIQFNLCSTYAQIAFQIIIIIIGDGWWWPNCTLIIRMRLCAVNSWIRRPIRFLCYVEKPPFSILTWLYSERNGHSVEYVTEPVWLFLFENFNSYVGWLSSIFGIYFVEIIYMMWSFFSCESNYIWC